MRENEAGQGLVTYPLILVLVAVVVVAILLKLGPPLSGADLAISKTVDSQTVLPRAPVDYRLHVEVLNTTYVHNARNVVVVDKLPSGHTFLGVTAYQRGERVSGICQLVDGTDVVCRVSQLNLSIPGIGGSINDLVIEIHTLAPIDVGTYVNTATSYADNAHQSSSGEYTRDSYLGNNTASTTLYVIPMPEGPAGDTASPDWFARRPFPSTGLSSGVKPQTTISAANGQKNNSSDLGEKLEAIDEQLRHQEESVAESGILLREALAETLEILDEYAREISDELFTEQLADLAEALSSEDYEPLPDLLLELGTQLALVPGDIQVAVVLKLEPLLIDGCLTMGKGYVGFEVFDETLQALEELEASAPGSTGQIIPSLLDAREVADQRNEIIEENTGLLALGIDSGIALLANSGDEMLLEIVQQFELDSVNCGNQ